MQREFNSKTIAELHQKLMHLFERQQLDGLWVTSTDAHLSEYTPQIENYRYWLTGFSGSVGEAYITRRGISVYVDGRYHEQADLECAPYGVEVVKVPYGTSLQEALEQTLHQQKAQSQNHLRVGVIEKCTPYAQVDAWRELATWVPLQLEADHELQEILPPNGHPAQGEVREVPVELCGRSRAEKWADNFQEGELFFCPTLDTLSWLLNARAAHRPFQSTLKGMGLFTKSSAMIFIDAQTVLPRGWGEDQSIQWIKLDDQSLRLEVFTELTQKFIDEAPALKELTCYSDAITLWHFRALQEINLPLRFLPGMTYDLHALKNSKEILAHRKSFLTASKAISTSLSTLSQRLRGGEALSEWDVRDSIEEEYRKLGMGELSFRTIAGVGANGSIIHYSKSSKERLIKASELILVDSGAYDQAGLATDTTRTILSWGEPESWQKEIYTLVLKSLIVISKTKFNEGTFGGILDDIARRPLVEKNYNYAHGTGHGVGILVHEGGYRIAPKSQVPLRAGLVGSLEPGIYLPGRGGVRLENVVEVRTVAGAHGLLEFAPMTYVGFDHRLIDSSLLSADEQAWLDQYEAECERLGTSFNP